MTNNVIDFTAYKNAKATTEAPAKEYSNNVISLEDYKAQCPRRAASAAIMSTTDVLMFGGHAA